VLRDPAGRDGDLAAGPELAPQPGIDELSELLGQARAAGLPVSFTVSGVPRPVPEGEALAVYRVVQESLTNVLKHTTADAASVRVTWSDDALDLEVVDPGPGRPAPGSAGHGLLGLEERVHLLGGRISSGPDGAGFRVAATLPTGRAA